MRKERTNAVFWRTFWCSAILFPVVDMEIHDISALFRAYKVWLIAPLLHYKTLCLSRDGVKYVRISLHFEPTLFSSKSRWRMTTNDTLRIPTCGMTVKHRTIQHTVDGICFVSYPSCLFIFMPVFLPTFLPPVKPPVKPINTWWPISLLFRPHTCLSLCKHSDI